MLYIVTALKSEAQAFVDKYKLQQTKLAHFKVFYNNEMILIVSGIGLENARYATQIFIKHYHITDEDIYLNIGICGASHKYEIGQLLEIGIIQYNMECVSTQSTSPLQLHCHDHEVSNNRCDIVDMESFGFYGAVINSPAIKNYHVLKVVSDHFEPHRVTKEATKSLIFNQIDAINLILNTRG